MGLKVTGQRMTILRYLYQSPKHITAQELFERIQPIDSAIGFATVYRFLRKLVEHDLLIEVRMGNMPARYELASEEHHDHLTCIACGAIKEFYNEEIERLQKVVAVEFGFELTDHVLELQGICSSCRGKGYTLEKVRSLESSSSGMDH